MSIELVDIIVTIVAAGLAILWFLWKLRRDIDNVQNNIANVQTSIGSVQTTITHVQSDVAELRERMARLEGLIEGYTRRESVPPREIGRKAND